MGLIGKMQLPFKRRYLIQLLKMQQKRGVSRCILFWNRGLGDIALGLAGLVHRIREYLPGVEILFVTRKDLEEGFHFLPNVSVYVDETWERGKQCIPSETLARLGVHLRKEDILFSNPDPTNWLYDQLGTFVPCLYWKEQWDILSKRFAIPKGQHIAVHVQTETGQYYGYKKDWPQEKWQALFQELAKKYPDKKILLFGLSKDPTYVGENILDLRGETTICEMFSVIRQYCNLLIAPDSGILSLLYYIENFSPMTLISLWADPNQGILKQNVASPNPHLRHYPLKGKDQLVHQISLHTVVHILEEEIL